MSRILEEWLWERAVGRHLAVSVGGRGLQGFDEFNLCLARFTSARREFNSTPAPLIPALIPFGLPAELQQFDLMYGTGSANAAVKRCQRCLQAARQFKIDGIVALQVIVQTCLNHFGCSQLKYQCCRLERRQIRRRGFQFGSADAPTPLGRQQCTRHFVVPQVGHCRCSVVAIYRRQHGGGVRMD